MKIGSLCTGYGGLDMAVGNVLGGDLVWYSESDKHASKLLKQHLPGVPNIGDLTQIDWDRVERVEVLTGGYPCQPFSVVGKRKGENDERNLWPHIRQAIRVLRPRYAIFENVAGHRSMGFGTVLRDCAQDGLDVRWCSVRASDVGAPHRRERLFFAVTTGRFGPYKIQPPRRVAPELKLFPTSRATDPASASSRAGKGFRPQLGQVVREVPEDWGAYVDAIQRWESVLGRKAPIPTEHSPVDGRPRMSPVFLEWFMGLPFGWVTSPALPRQSALKLLGNGVVPQQAELALRQLLN